jgi:fibrillarin-like pre-rRNA processing protein
VGGVSLKEAFEGVYKIDDKLATKNLIPGSKAYDEKLVMVKGEEFRFWNPNRSKLSAAILSGLKSLPIKNNSKVLYLGAASGTTASHSSDISSKGLVFCVEFAPAPMSKLLVLCKKRDNMIPLFYDADRPQRYAPLLEAVDVIYQDVAQKNQAEILIKNSDLYLKDGGYALLAVKARSIESTKGVEAVISGEIARLKPYFKIVEVVDLKPYEKDHSMVLAKKL